MRAMMVLATFGLLVENAHANCKPGKPVFSPPSDVRLPPRPTIFITVPKNHREDHLNVQGRHRAVMVASSEAYDLVRVDIDADDGRAHAMVTRPHFGVQAAYEIGGADPNRIDFTGVTRNTEWSVDFMVSGNAIALRFAWDDGDSTLVPVLDGAARLGEIPCLGFNIEKAKLEKHRVFVLFAVFADGSEHRVGVSDLQLGNEVRMPTELVEMRAIPQLKGTPLKAVRTVAAAPERSSVWPGVLGGLVALGGALVLRMRRRRDHRPRS